MIQQSKKQIKIGVIGCSRIAESSVIPAIINSKFATVAIIGSRNLKKASVFSKKFQCTKYGTYEDVINERSIDAVYISTPVGLHEKWAIEAMKAGKHVLCEKSATISYESAKKMVTNARKNKLRLLEGFMFRFHPSHKKIKELIKKNTIGDIFSFYGEYGFADVPHSDIRYNKELGGGILNDATCYPICASRIIFEKIPNEVFCQLVMDDRKNVDVKSYVMLKYSDNQIANMIGGYGLGYQSKYRIWGKKGLIQLSRAYNIPESMKPKIRIEYPDKEKEFLIQSANHFKLMIDSFCKEISKQDNSLFDFEEDLLIQARVLEACRRSHKEKKSIKILDIK